jgi:hypothetical protein
MHVRPGEGALAALYPCIQDPGKGIRPSANGARAEQLPFGDAFPNGENSPPAQSANNDVAKFPLFPRRACAHPKSGGSRQPLDRQVRYYSESVEVASRDFGTSVAATGTGGGLRLKKAP